MPRPAPGEETKNFQTTHVSSVPLRGQFYFDTGGTLTVIYVGHSSALMKVKSRWESLLSLGFLPRAQSGANTHVLEAKRPCTSSFPLYL